MLPGLRARRLPHKPKSALYSCVCGAEFEGLKAWNEHMTARSLLRKRECPRAALEGSGWNICVPSTTPPPISPLSRPFPPFCASAVPERVSLEKIMKKKKGSGRGSPMEIDGDDAPLRDMDTVYINMTKREDRKKLCLGEMRAQGLTGRRFPAKTGDEVPKTQVATSWHSKLNCLYDKKTVSAEHMMSRGERGCSGSHIALWKQCAKRDDPSKPMLILEDDVVLHDRSSVNLPEMCHRLIAAVEQVVGRRERAGRLRRLRGTCMHANQRFLVSRHTPLTVPQPFPPCNRLSRGATTDGSSSRARR